MQLIDNPDVVKAAIAYEVRRNNAPDAYYIRPGQDAVAWGQDFAGTGGPFVSPAMFREFALPAITARVAHVHEAHGLPVVKHACGDNRLLLNMFVEAGYDVSQWIQESARMELDKIKSEYRQHFACMGGLPVETLLVRTPEDVRREVRRNGGSDQ